MQTVLELTEKLMPRLANEFQRRLLAATVQSVQETSNPLRLNNFSASFRELFRHVLVELAPDQDVVASSWFVPDQKNQGRVTRAQKVKYVIHGGLNPAYVEDVLGIDVATERKALLETINQLSKFTHVNEDSFDSSQQDVERHALAACDALQSFLDCAEEARKLLCSRVEERVHDDIISETIRETIQSLDEIATHHYIDEIDIHQVEVTALNHSEIQFTAYGSIGVLLQWGSNSDLRRDEGAIVGDSYPLTCNFISKVDSPEELEMIEDSLRVDTSSWWDGYHDDER